MEQPTETLKGIRVVTVTMVLFVASILAFVQSTPTYAQSWIAVTSCGTVISTPNAVAVLTADLACSTGNGVEITADGVKLHLNRHVIKGVPGSGAVGIRSEGNYVRIKGPGVVTLFDEGIRIQSVSRNWVEGVTVSKAHTAGIHIYNAAKNHAKYNVVYFTMEGIRVEGSGASGNLIEGNTVFSTSSFGIGLSGVAGNYVKENTLLRNPIGVLVGDGSSNNEIEENNVSSSSHSGITIGVNEVTTCAANNNNEVESNIIGNNSGFGVEIAVPSTCPASQTGNQISHNTFFSNGPAITDQGSGTAISGNIIVP